MTVMALRLLLLAVLVSFRPYKGDCQLCTGMGLNPYGEAATMAL